MHTAYIETSVGVYKETGGVMSGPFTRGELGLADVFVPQCQTLKAAGARASLSFGFGYGARADNTFEEVSRG